MSLFRGTAPASSPRTSASSRTSSASRWPSAACPGYKVLRWEREWHAGRQPFRDPRGYPACSVATSGTHDTESMAEWWDGADLDERRAVAGAAGRRATRACRADAPFSDATRDALLAALFRAGSDFAAHLPMQDVFGWRDRINTPSLVSDENWTWRLPWPVERSDAEPGRLERRRSCARRSSAETGPLPLPAP